MESTSKNPYFYFNVYSCIDGVSMANASEKRQYNCTQCSYVTDRKNNLKRHLLTMHQECSRQLECCGLPFKSKACLRDHVVYHHQGGYECQICGRNFCRKALLRRHLAVHNGQKDFRCKHCPYATSHKSNLERHQKVHTRHLANVSALGGNGKAFRRNSRTTTDDNSNISNNKWATVKSNMNHVNSSFQDGQDVQCVCSNECKHTDQVIDYKHIALGTGIGHVTCRENFVNCIKGDSGLINCDWSLTYKGEESARSPKEFESSKPNDDVLPVPVAGKPTQNNETDDDVSLLYNFDSILNKIICDQFGKISEMKTQESNTSLSKKQEVNNKTCFQRRLFPQPYKCFCGLLCTSQGEFEHHQNDSHMNTSWIKHFPITSFILKRITRINQLSIQTC